MISNPPLADAKEAARAAVVSPLHVTVTVPAATTDPALTVIDITLLE